MLFYLEGTSGAEAATALGISEAALRVRLHRARAALRERLEERLRGFLGEVRPGEKITMSLEAILRVANNTGFWFYENIVGRYSAFQTQMVHDLYVGNNP